MHGLKISADSSEAPGHVSCLDSSLGFCPPRWGAVAAVHAGAGFGVGSSCPHKEESTSQCHPYSSHQSCTPDGQPLPAKIPAHRKDTDDEVKVGQQNAENYYLLSREGGKGSKSRIFQK